MLSNLYLDHIVLFVGVSADEIAISRRLLELRATGFKPNAIFWLTTRTDPVTAQWASDAGVMMINYQALDNAEHDTVIQLLVKDCTAFISIDTMPELAVNKNIDPNITGIETDPFRIHTLPPAPYAHPSGVISIL